MRHRHPPPDDAGRNGGVGRTGRHLERYRVHDHAADDGCHVGGRGGRHRGPARPPLCRGRRRILTGFVEPHFFAGWSGGPKGTCPGLAATSTILEAHSPDRIADAGATWLITEGNPVHEFVSAATALCPPDLSVDVTIDAQRRLTGVFTGVLPGRPPRRQPVRRPQRDRVGRGPLRRGAHHQRRAPAGPQLYQAVKGMAAAERVVADGGIIVMAAACADGLPEPGAFARILRAASSPSS